MVMHRRDFLGCLGLAAMAPAVASCDANPADPTTSPTPQPSTNSRTPQAVPSGTDVEFWADDSRYPAGWTDRLAQLAGEQPTPLGTRITSTGELAASLSVRFREQNPPQLVLNGGSDELGIGELADQLTDLTPVVKEVDAAGKPLEALLRPGTVEAGTVDGRLLAIPYVYTVHGLWYSAEFFREQHWQAPTAWPQLMALGERAKAQNKFLFGWGRDGATTYLRMALAMAAKQGGVEVVRALDRLEAKAWSQPAVQASLTAIHDAVRAGYVKPGGSQRSWRTAMASWSSDRSVLMVPCGSWIGAQMQPSASFELSVVPDPVLDGTSALPATALHAGPEETFLVPAASKSSEAGKALLRVALGRPASTHCAQTHQVIPTRTDALPADPGPVLTQQLALLKAADRHVFSWRFIGHYGINHDHQALWNAFLEGGLDVATLTRESQRISDLVAADPAQTRFRAE